MSEESNTDHFYARLPVYDDMRCIIEPTRPTPVPEDWYVIIADINSSTGAIEKGLYREINTIGVSAIIAVLNITDGLEIPYIFGGDGATICVPESLIGPATEALSATIDMARESFELELKVGCLPVSEITGNGHYLMIARCRMSHRLVNAMLIGDGVKYVENVFNGEIENTRYREVTGNANHQADFSGFECRWQEVPSRHGEVISLLLKVTAPDAYEEALIYAEMFEVIERIYGDEAEHHPLNLAGLKLSISPEKLSQDYLVRTFSNSSAFKLYYFLKIIFQTLLGKLIFSRLLERYTGDWRKYKPALIRNTDYRKFDGMLKMVIAGSSEKREKLLIILNEYEKLDKIVYGIHVSDSAQLTCMVNDLKQDHIHFVDGAGGGYTLAAAQLKNKISKFRTTH